MPVDPRDPWRLSPEFVEACKRLNEAFVAGARELGARWAAAVEASKAPPPPVDADLDSTSTKELTE